MQATLRYAAFIVAGGVLILSLFADQLGIGAAPGFGHRQLGGVLLGIASLAAMVWISMRNR